MLKQAIASYPATTALSRQATITSARVDPEAPPAIFRPLRRTGPFGPRPKAPVAELVDALELKIEFRKECWFDSGQGHQRFIPSYEVQLCPPHRGSFRCTTTVAAFALGDYEWLLALEADELHDTVDLMRHLRASGARMHVREEIPFFWVVVSTRPGSSRCCCDRLGAGRPASGRRAQLPDPRRQGYDAVLLAGFGGPEGPRT